MIINTYLHIFESLASLENMKLSFLFVFFVVQCATFSQSLFYIYDWAKDFNDVWPPEGAVLHNRSGYNHQFRENNGAGRLLDPAVGLFQTWQFSLYKNVMSRLRVSEFRTR